MQYKVFYFNPIRVCTYVAWDDTGECVIIDPGCHTPGELDRLVSFIGEQRLKPVSILLTHAHFDHLMGVDDLRVRWDVPLLMHPEEEQQLRWVNTMASFGDCDAEAPRPPYTWIRDGEILRFGQTELEVIWTPGHTAGCVCYYCRAGQLLFSGDTLFEGGIGRTDLPTGDAAKLRRSFEERLMTLPDDVRVLPGHGYPTTIGTERAYNPFSGF